MDEDKKSKKEGGENRLEQVRKAQLGDSNAFAQIVRDIAPRAYGLAFSFLKNHEDAEDISQEAFIRAFKNLKSFDLSKPFETWFFTILVNLCKNKLRWKNLRAKLTFSLDMLFQVDEEDDPRPMQVKDPNKGIEPDSAFKESYMQKNLQDAISKLSGQQRSAIHLKFQEGYKISEIAEMMNVSEGTVKTHIFRAMERLKKIIGDKNNELF